MGWKVFQYLVFCAGVLLGLWFAMHIDADPGETRGMKMWGGLIGLLAAWLLTKIISWIIDLVRYGRAKGAYSPPVPTEHLACDPLQSSKVLPMRDRARLPEGS
jgi:hypothetical protein